MFQIIGEMRHFIHARTKAGIYSVATFKDWADPSRLLARSGQGPNVPSDRHAQFCWFLASTIGNTDLNCAGTWFPFCAHSRDDTSEIFGAGMNDEEFIKLDDFLKANSFQSVRGLIAVENTWVRSPLAQLRRSLEEDIETVQFQTPSSKGSMSASVVGSMSSRDPFRDLGIPPRSPAISRSPSPAPPPKRRKRPWKRPKRRSPSPRSQADLVLGMIAEGEKFDIFRQRSNSTKR